MNRHEARDAIGTIELTTLDAVAASQPRGDAWLGDDERARLATMRSELRRQQFVAGHWLARVLAGNALGIEPGRIGLDRETGGRPRLRVDGRPSRWHVSLTHSAEHVACAVAPGPVGLDLELPRPRRDLAALARFTFAPGENARLAALDDAERLDEFYRLWGLKEARGKRCGDGLRAREARRVQADACDAAGAEATTWTASGLILAVAAERAGAFAVAGLPAGSRVAHWRFVEAAADAATAG